jgi:UDP-N-acetyl-2-amino-2-deoxyglucuronate dehydrogenase
MKGWMKMNNQQLGIAVIGCGMIGKHHLKAIESIPELRIAGIWDEVTEASRHVARIFNTKSYHGFSELIGDPEVDVVDICLPSGLHSEVGCAVANAGKHVIVEKPIDISLEKATRLVDTCRQAQVFLAVILQNRFSPSVLRVKQALNENALGRILAGEATIKWYREPSYYKNSPWKGTKALDGGGALLNQGVHTIDLFQWFLGEVQSLTSIVKTTLHQIEMEDLAMAIVEFKSGALGTITGSTAMKPGLPERIEIYGTKGNIALEGGRIVRWQVDGQLEDEYLDSVSSGSGSSDPNGILVENHRRQLTAIAQAIAAGSQPPVSGEEALTSLKLILDIYSANKKWLKQD